VTAYVSLRPSQPTSRSRPTWARRSTESSCAATGRRNTRERPVHLLPDRVGPSRAPSIPSNVYEDHDMSDLQGGADRLSSLTAQDLLDLPAVMQAPTPATSSSSRASGHRALRHGALGTTSRVPRANPAKLAVWSVNRRPHCDALIRCEAVVSDDRPATSQLLPRHPRRLPFEQGGSALSDVDPDIEQVEFFDSPPGDLLPEQAGEEAEIYETDPHPAPVSYTGSDFDVEGLVRRLERHDIVIPTFGHEDPGIETARFQRDFVWRRPQMDRFIESLLLGYPIPGIFLVQQRDKRYLVLDGQQRLRTLAAFYGGVHNGREFALSNVGDDYKGLTYKLLGDEQRRTLDNTFIQATIVQTDGSPGSLDAVYQVFERLNSGGTQLTPHEIRIALYAGPFIAFLTSLNSEEDWRELYGPRSPRLRDQELLLRVVALYVSPGTYRRPLKKYLNEFVGRQRFLSDLNEELVAVRFREAAHILRDAAGSSAFRYRSAQVNAALTEAIMVGTMRRLDAGTLPSPESAKRALQGLLDEDRFVAAISRATADEENVRTRLAIATQALGAT